MLNQRMQWKTSLQSASRKPGRNLECLLQRVEGGTAPADRLRHLLIKQGIDIDDVAGLPLINLRLARIRWRRYVQVDDYLKFAFHTKHAHVNTQAPAAATAQGQDGLFGPMS